MRNISAILLILGSVIGAGFATGKEIVVFYADYGLLGVCGIMLSIVLFYLLFSRYMIIGKHNIKSESKTLDIIMLISMILVTGTLFGASNEFDTVGKTAHFSIVGILTLLVTIIILFGGIDGITKFSIFIVPLMALIFLGVSIVGVNIDNFDNIVHIFKNNIFSAIFKSIGYVGINTMLSSGLLMDIGKSVTRPKLVAILSSIIFGICILISSLSIISNGVMDNDMPMYVIANGIGGVMGKIYLLVLWFAIITSLVSIVYSLSIYCEKVLLNKWVRVIGISVICYIISFIGFGHMVEYFYPIIGLFGIVYYMYLEWKYKKTIKV